MKTSPHPAEHFLHRFSERKGEQERIEQQKERGEETRKKCQRERKKRDRGDKGKFRNMRQDWSSKRKIRKCRREDVVRRICKRRREEKKTGRITSCTSSFSVVFWELPKPADARRSGEAWPQLHYITLTHNLICPIATAASHRLIFLYLPFFPCLQYFFPVLITYCGLMKLLKEVQSKTKSKLKGGGVKWHCARALYLQYVSLTQSLFIAAKSFSVCATQCCTVTSSGIRWHQWIDTALCCQKEHALSSSNFFWEPSLTLFQPPSTLLTLAVRIGTFPPLCLLLPLSLSYPQFSLRWLYGGKKDMGLEIFVMTLLCCLTSQAENTETLVKTLGYS